MTTATHPQHKPEEHLLMLQRNAIDRDCKSYLAWKEQEKAAKAKADEIKARIMLTVEQHGFVPTNAEKSRRIEAAQFVATVTSAIGIEVNDSKVYDLELLLSKARCSKAFRFLFERRVEYSISKTAAEAIATTPWPKKYREQITALYSACFTPKPKTPSLDVETRESVMERERKAAEKAAKKLRGGKAAA